jgi:hypothetical protein
MVKLLLLVLASSLLALQASAATQADLAVEALCNDKERRLNPPAPNVSVLQDSWLACRTAQQATGRTTSRLGRFCCLTRVLLVAV